MADFLQSFVDTKLYKISQETDLYIRTVGFQNDSSMLIWCLCSQAHAENDFPYISAEVETICKV